MPRDRKCELERLAFAEDDDPLLVGETRHVGDLVLVAERDRLSAEPDREARRGIEPQAGEARERRVFLGGKDRDTVAAARRTASSGSGSGTSSSRCFSMKPVSILAPLEIGFDQRVEQEAGVGPDRPDFDLVEHRGELVDRFVAVFAPAISLAIIGS